MHREHGLSPKTCPQSQLVLSPLPPLEPALEAAKVKEQNQ